MKNHIIFKFIAILLCAASLLGVLAAGGSILTLTGLDLYNRSVDQFFEEQLTEHGRWFSEDVSSKYFSATLGGCPQTLVDLHYGWYTHFTPGTVSYQILDEDGKPLPDAYQLVGANGERIPNRPAREGETTYRFPMEGTYIHLVDQQVQVPCESLTAGVDYVILYHEGDTFQLEVQALPENTTDPIRFESFDETVATVDENGLITAVGPGGMTEIQVTCGPHFYRVTVEFTRAPEAVEPTPVTEPIRLDGPVTRDAQRQAAPPAETEAGPAAAAAVTKEPDIAGKPLSAYDLNTFVYHDSETNQRMEARVIYPQLPKGTVEVHVTTGALEMGVVEPVLRLMWNNSRYLFPALGICLLVFAVCLVYLCCAAGRRPKSDQVRASGLNRIPMDLYAAAVIGFTVLLLVLSRELAGYLLEVDLSLACLLALCAVYADCLLFVGFLFAFAAQCKMPNWFLARNTLCGLAIRAMGWCFTFCLKGLVWLAKKVDQHVIPFLGRVLRKLWMVLSWGWKALGREMKKLWALLGKGAKALIDMLQRFLSLLPMTWQWLLTGFLMIIVLVFSMNVFEAGGMILVFAALMALVFYGAHCFGVLMDSAKRMSKGDLDEKVPDKELLGSFKDFAGILNDLADVAVVAARKQLKSERMKTELITNVSHDIKTPLTSIINYTDLLQKPHTPEEEQQYLEVLNRQSMQLKKLIEDLIEMSKASTGNLAVNITTLDAIEAVNQALGEFSDKLEKASLTPVFRHSEDTAPMLGDGKLAWRVLHNLLSNACKYALPGTRLYIDLMQLEGKVILSLKNVSRDQLNVDAEELMERFVRGDGSRNTEGSGLGLNIAKSMMELQHGSLQLLVDGDLFKVTLIFPGA